MDRQLATVFVRVRLQANNHRFDSPVSSETSGPHLFVGGRVDPTSLYGSPTRCLTRFEIWSGTMTSRSEKAHFAMAATTSDSPGCRSRSRVAMRKHLFGTSPDASVAPNAKF